MTANGRHAPAAMRSVAMSCAQSNEANAGACTDDTGFFNYTDYQNSALRLFRVDLTAALKATDHLVVPHRNPSEMAEPAGGIRLYLHISRGRRATSTSRSGACRRPSARSRADVRERQPAHRLSARLPVPDVAPARSPCRRELPRHLLKMRGQGLERHISRRQSGPPRPGHAVS